MGSLPGAGLALTLALRPWPRLLRKEGAGQFRLKFCDQVGKADPEIARTDRRVSERAAQGDAELGEGALKGPGFAGCASALRRPGRPDRW